MVENLGPIAGALAIFGIAWFMFPGYWGEYERLDNKAKTLATILPGLILIVLPIFGTGILLVAFILGFELPK
ncbi:MAG: hypothetical protein VB913_05945 [Rhodospirillales bacterium]